MPRKSQKPVRVRGYRIRVYSDGTFFPDGTHYDVLGVFWQPEPHLPPEWEQITHNPHVIRAVLVRSGRKFATYVRS